MGTKGFRRSLMGFNREDVLNYITLEDKKNAKKIKKLDDEIKELSARNLYLTQEIDNLNNALLEYKNKEDEINRLAESIGALYIIAKNNAEIILDNSLKSKDAAINETQKNIELLKSAQENYINIKNELSKITSSFANNIDSALSSINTTEKNIEDNFKNASEAEKVLTEALK